MTCPGGKSRISPSNPHPLCVGCGLYQYAADGMTPTLRWTVDGARCENHRPKSPRAIGGEAGEACEAKAAEVADFDSRGASDVIYDYLKLHGRTSGEVLVDMAVSLGFKPHDQRSFGPVMARLVAKKRIKCVGVVERRKGHGSAGARLWEAI